MIKTRVLSIICTLTVLTAGSALADPSPSPSASASAPPSAAQTSDPAVAARAKEWVHRLQTGDIDRSQLDADVNTAMTPDLVTRVSSQLISLGDPLAFAFVTRESVQDSTLYVYRVTFKNATFNELFSVDKDGKISGLRFVPVQ